jgi:predicted flavoprotein YhiN
MRRRRRMLLMKKREKCGESLSLAGGASLNVT